jgi:uncharacterized protein with LGFP repeats
VPAWSCSTTTATDARTGSHSAPGLPHCTGIDQHYTHLGGPGSYLGEALTGERPAADGGAYTHYDRGSIYWHADTGAHAVRGAIREKWKALGWERGKAGFPVTDERPCPDGKGRYNHFNGTGGGASIYYHPSTGAFAVWGAIRTTWKEHGWEAGKLGYPVTDEKTCPDGQGRYNHFNGTSGGASIYYHPSTGAHAVYGAIRTKWQELGWEQGPLGYPKTSERACPDGEGRYNHFAKGRGGSIYWHPTTDAHAVWGAIRDTWAKLGWEAGPLGYPVTDELGVKGGRYNDFLGGGTVRSPGASVYWSSATGAVSVRGPIREAWLDNGGATGRLGFPTAEPRSAGDQRTRSDFEGGYVVHDADSGETIVTFT